MARAWGGGTDSVSCSSALFGGSFPFTMAVWARFTSISAGDHAFLGVYNGTTNDDGYRIVADWDGSTKRARCASKQAGTPQQATVATGITDTNWHSFIGVITSTTRRDIWVDNSTTANNTTSVTPPTISTTGIGIRLADNDRNNNHQIARACAWNIDIGAAGRAAYHAGVSPLLISPANLILYVEDIRDFVDAKGNAWTVTGTSTVDHPRLSQVPRNYLTPFQSGGSNITVAVPAGSLSLTGFEPSVNNPVTVSVPAGALLLTGFAPTVNNPVTIQVPAGSLTLTGNAPNITQDITIAVPSGSLALTGLAPTVVTDGSVTIQVPAGALVLTGFEPVVVNPRTVAVPAGSLALTGNAPTIGNTSIVVVPAGSLVLTGRAPVVNNGSGGGGGTVTLVGGVSKCPTDTVTINGTVVVADGLGGYTTQLINTVSTDNMDSVDYVCYHVTQGTGGGATTISVPSGSLALTGFEPTVTDGSTGFFEWRGDFNSDVPPPIPTGFSFLFDGTAGTSMDFAPYDSFGNPITVVNGLTATISFDPSGDIPAAHGDFAVTSFQDLSSGDSGFRLTADGANAPYTGMTLHLFPEDLLGNPIAWPAVDVVAF